MDDDFRHFLSGLVTDVVMAVEEYDEGADARVLVPVSSAVFMLLDLRPKLLEDWRSSVCGASAVWFRAASQAWGRPEFLNTAIALGREALALPMPVPAERLAHRHNLSRALVAAFEYLGDDDLLQEAVSIMETAVDELDADDPDRLELLNAWGSTLCQVHVRRMSEQALDHGLAVLRTAVSETPKGDRRLPARLNNLGLALRRLAEQTAEIVHLDESVDVYRSALATNPGPAMTAALDNSLATALHDRFLRSGSRDALREAVDRQRESVKLTAEGDSRELGRRNNLAGYLIEWHDQTRDDAALTEAVTVLEDLEHTANGRLEHAAVLQHLANALHRLASRELLQLGATRAAGDPFGEEEQQAVASAKRHLERAESLRRQVVDLLPMTSPQHPGVQRDLAKTLLRLDELEENPFRHAEALGLLTDAFERGRQVAPIGAIDAGRGLLVLHGDLDDPRAAADYGQRALHLARYVALAQVGQQDRRLLLRELLDLPHKTAYAWVQAGERRRAVEALELGRAVLLSDATALAELASSAPPDEAEAILTLRGDLASFDILSVAQRQASAAVVDHLIFADQPPGHRLRTPTWASIADAAQVRPLLYLSPGEMTGMALLVASGEDIEAYPCPEMTTGAAERATTHYLDALAHLRDDPPDLTAAEGALTAMALALDSLLPAQVHDRLARLDAVAVIATGGLAPLPFQVLGTTTLAGPLLARGVTITSSPSAAALRWAARARDNNPLTPRVLVAVTRGEDATPAADLEVACAQTLGIPTTALLDEGATVAAVLDNLHRCGWVHVVSHGMSDPWNAATSALRLIDGPLSAQRLFSAPLGQGRLALLTSCESAVGELELPDENSGLPVAFLHAGFGGVVGADWPVSGVVAAKLADTFSAAVVAGTDPAVAYRDAVTQLHGATMTTLLAWAEDAASKHAIESIRGLLRLRSRRSPTVPAEPMAGGMPLVAWAAFRYIGW